MAFAAALDDGYHGVVTVDGNGQDGVKAIGRFRDRLDDGYAYVQGSRFVPGGVAVNTPWSRYLGIRLLHAPLLSAGARTWYTDTTNGFRGHSARLLADPRVNVFRDVFDAHELLAYLPVRAARLGLRVCEVPVTRAYPAGAVPTKIKGLSGNLDLLGVAARAATGRYDPAPDQPSGGSPGGAQPSSRVRVSATAVTVTVATSPVQRSHGRPDPVTGSRRQRSTPAATPPAASPAATAHQPAHTSCQAPARCPISR